MKKLPSQDTIKKHLDYDPETGKATWKSRDDDPAWTGRYAGTRAGYKVGVYWYIKLFKEAYSLHRVIWKLMKGEDPLIIDHINHNSLDNRIDNLRNVDELTNQRNHKYKGKQLGIKKMKSGRWSARIKVAGESVWLGTHDTEQEATDVRLAAEKKYGFHEMHGKLCE